MSNGFSITTMFVVPNGTLATTGSTQDLTPQQLGVFRPDYSIATTGNIAAAKYFYIAQGRAENVPGLGSKRSDKIAPSLVKEWYKLVGEPDVAQQITRIDNFHFKCGDNIVFTFRVQSNLLDVAFYNGYTKSVVVKAPCCDCGGIPCDDIAAGDTQTLIDTAIAKLNQVGYDQYNGGDVLIGNFLQFSRTGSGATSAMLVTAKPQNYPSPLPSDISTNQYEYDRVWFRAFVKAGTETTADFYVDDSCDVVATATVLQRGTYASGSSNEIALMEQRYYSYQTSAFKHLHRNPGYNGAFQSYVTAGLTYDTYYIVSNEYDESQAFGMKVPQDFRVILAFPQGQATQFETLMTATLGAPANISDNDVSTTTTTSTTSTSTTTTTTLQP